MPKERGQRGARGPAGPRGRQGHTGARGPTGKQAPASERSTTGNDVLDIVEKQIDDIHRELDVQMKHVGRLQVQVDELRAAVRRLVSAVPTV